MDREIKFRAFDSKRKSFTNYQIMDDLILFLEKHTGCWLSNKENRFELMRYTGLKDKKGKEIYEGDLVEISDSDDDIICQVKYEYGSFILVKGEYTEYLGEVEERFLEIVGNIFQNEELLEE